LSARTLSAGLLIAIVAFLYRLIDGASLVNDHFMHLVWGRQMLWGRLPIRDSVSLGMPLQTGLSAAAEWLVGYRLLSEALVVSTAFATGAFITFILAKRASGHVAIAVAAAVLEIAIAPRTYSYPKIIVYAAGLLLLWRYVDQPSIRRAVLLGVATAVAFYVRHDHGLYLGLVVAAVMALRHWATWQTAARASLAFASVCVLLVAPYLVYVQVNGGLWPVVQDLRQFNTREHSQNPFIWPAWPLSSVTSVARWTTADERSASVAIRWSAGASDDIRRQAAERYQLQGTAGAGPLESGRFTLRDVSRRNAVALMNDPAIEDTGGIDRVTGEVPLPGWYVGPLRILEGLDGPPASAALLFFTFVTVMIVTAVVLLRGSQPGPLGPWERVKVGAVLLVGVLTFIGFVRESIDARIGDAVVAPVLLAAWLCGKYFRTSRPSTWIRVGRVALLVVVLIPLTRSVVVAGGVGPRLQPREPYSAVWRRLVTSPPFDAWPAQGSAKYRIVKYVRECTGPREPLLVLWFAPEYYYYADRPFAGRMGAYMNGYYISADNQWKNRAALERDRPPIAILEAGREVDDLAGHSSALDYLAEDYHQIGELAATDGTILRVFGRNDRQPTSTQSDVGWPCYV
jgi:hypothetical protein